MTRFSTDSLALVKRRIRRFEPPRAVLQIRRTTSLDGYFVLTGRPRDPLESPTARIQRRRRGGARTGLSAAIGRAETAIEIETELV